MDAAVTCMTLHAARTGHSGFSLVETLVATALLGSSVAALAHLLAVSMINTSAARQTTFATILAADKIEDLRGLDIPHHRQRFPLTAAGLAPSPGRALEADTPGYVDYLDERGNAIDAGGPAAPRHTVFIRRWSITPLAAVPSDAIVLHVRVISRDPHGEVELVTVRARAAG